MNTHVHTASVVPCHCLPCLFLGRKPLGMASILRDAYLDILPDSAGTSFYLMIIVHRNERFFRQPSWVPLNFDIRRGGGRGEGMTVCYIWKRR